MTLGQSGPTSSCPSDLDSSLQLFCCSHLHALQRLKTYTLRQNTQHPITIQTPNSALLPRTRCDACSAEYTTGTQWQNPPEIPNKLYHSRCLISYHLVSTVAIEALSRPVDFNERLHRRCVFCAGSLTVRSERYRDIQES